MRCSGVSFRVDRGEVLGVAALEGQGQEELFDCIAGVRRADAGEVRAEGRVLKLRHPADAIRAGLVLVPANRLRVAAAAALRAGERGAGRVRPIALLGPDCDGRGETPRRHGRAEIADRHPRGRGSADASAAATCRRSSSPAGSRPGFKTLLCFDPTRGIDIGTKKQIYALMREIADQGAVRPLVHVRTARDSPRLRSGDRSVRRPHLRRNAGGGSRRSAPLAGGAWPDPRTRPQRRSHDRCGGSKHRRLLARASPGRPISRHAASVRRVDGSRPSRFIPISVRSTFNPWRSAPCRSRLPRPPRRSSSSAAASTSRSAR